MVQWIKQPGSNDEGVTAGYVRYPGSGGAGRPTRSGLDGHAVKLASPGTVDANAITRFQYYLPGEDMPLWVALAAFRYDAADFDQNPGRILTSTMFVAPDSAFAEGVVPTPAQIVAASVEVVRGWGGTSSNSGRGDPGDLLLTHFKAPGGLMAPNTKWWLLVAPTSVAWTQWMLRSQASTATDIPIGDVNVNGRAVSLWTNRTPEAPILNNPASAAGVFSGETIQLSFTPQDPDRVSSFPGDEGQTDFDDVAGVHIQFAEQPTEANPDPTWFDMLIGTADGTGWGRGWFIDRSATLGPNDGAMRFWQTYKLPILCGTIDPLAPYSAHLPSGNWQVRVRTFDYGHPYPDALDGTGSTVYWDGKPPLADNSGMFTPDNYPAVNTSPWSEPAYIKIVPQVPKPLALSPVNSIAIREGVPVTLSWRYRNTYTPPFPQEKRTVLIRRVGDEDWTTLLNNEESASASYVVTGFPLVSGNQYEWRVKVIDSSGFQSEFSDSAYFWVVPESEGGGVLPDPTDTIDGATLGCGTHRIEVFRRGGKERVGEITGVSSVEWNRVRDDISTARIVVSGWDIDCGNLLASLQTWAYELVIYRDNGYDVDRVWEGPITLLTYENDEVVIQAKDVMGYAYRRIIRQAMIDGGSSVNNPNVGRTVVARSEAILLNAFAPDDPNVLAYLNAVHSNKDAKQYRSTPAYSRTAFEEVDDMAANAGLDYTAVGRSIILWGTRSRIGTLPEFTDKDLGSSPIVSEYGMSMANHYVVSDGNGVFGAADRLNEDGEDPTYGLVEMLSSTWASEGGDEEAGTYTEAGLAKVRESFAESSERSIADRYPPPMIVRVPDNTRLNPDVVLSIRHLVPGVAVPLHSTNTLRRVKATQKLDAVKVVEVDGTETITITLSPFSRDDTEMVDPE